MSYMTGYNGKVEVILSGTTYTEVVGLTQIDVDTSRDKYPATVMGDTAKSNNVGLANFAATISGLVPSDSSAIYQLNDGVAKQGRIWLDRSAASTQSHRWQGSMLFDIKTSSPVEGNISVELTVVGQSPGVTYTFGS